MFAKKTFQGGSHPPTQKRATQTSLITSLPTPSRVIIPLSQHTGAPAEPIVAVGDQVTAGQKIGEAQGYISAPVHASIGGKVTVIGPHLHPLGGELPAVIIESDGGQPSPEFFQAPGWSPPSDPKGMIEAVQEAGIVGLGGAAFPTHVKLSPPENKPINTCILNGAECEPYLTADHRLMVEHGDEIIAGLKLILTILNCRRGLIGIEANKPDALAAMRQRIQGEDGLTVIPLQVKYPQGAEKQLIWALTRREVPSGGLPMDVGCVVQNVGTARAVDEAVSRGKPLIERVVTITGPLIGEPRNVRVPIGTLFREVIEFCGGTSGEPGKLIMGGPMMGLAQASDEVPVIKGTSGILVLGAEQAVIPESQACIGCARCVDTCPMKLVPTQLAKLTEHGRFAEAEEQGVLDCMECGTCSYVCPSKINLVHLFKFAKSKIFEDRRKKKDAQAA
jgi:electron transport complex protein RnfC